MKDAALLSPDPPAANSPASSTAISPSRSTSPHPARASGQLPRGAARTGSLVQRRGRLRRRTRHDPSDKMDRGVRSQGDSAIRVSAKFVSRKGGEESGFWWNG